MATILTPTGVTFPDSSAQSVASNYILRVFTGPGTWTKSAGLKAIKVTVVGGGGGGGAAGDSSYSGTTGPPLTAPSVAAGGGAGGSVVGYITAANLPGPQPVTVGAGGPTDAIQGYSGSASNFGSYMTGNGGGSGGNSNHTIYPLLYLSTSQGSGGGAFLGPLGPSVTDSMTVPGGSGSASFNTSAAPLGAGGGGAGGASIFGNGRGGAAASRGLGGGSGSQTGANYGGGGGGAALYYVEDPNPSTPGYLPGSRAGGAGAAGVVIVEEFYS